MRPCALSALFVLLGVVAAFSVDAQASQPLPPLGIYHARSTADPWLIDGPDGFRWLDASVSISRNPDSPQGGNDGAAWQGRGWNTWAQGGFQGKWGPFSATLEPQVSFAQNLGFELLPSSRSNGLGDYWWGLDWLQREGTSPVAHWDWGNTEVRAQWGPVSAGFGTESIWLGSAWRNSILLSNNAGGFPHLDVGSTVPWRTDWGTLEGKMLWGGLTSSSGDLNRFFHGLVLAYQPPVFENLTVGAARLFYSPWQTMSWWKAFESVDDSFWKVSRGIYSGVSGDDDVDQLAAVYLDLQFPEQGFHAYGEIARNDHAWDWRDFLGQPDHSQGYVFGVDQTIRLDDDRSLFLRYEQADLGLTIGTTIRGTGSWYRHGPNPDGYTLNGQLLGAQIGPGSNSQTLELGGRQGATSVSLVLERVARDVDYYLQVIAPQNLPYPKIAYIDVVTYYGLKGAYTLDRWKFEANLGVSGEMNRNYQFNNDVSGIAVSTTITYLMGK